MNTRQLRGIGFFYRQVCPLTLTVSLLMCLVGTANSVPAFHFFLKTFFWLRTLVQLVVYLLYWLVSSGQLVFYQNLGISPLRLAVCTYLIDAAICSVFLFLTFPE